MHKIDAPHATASNEFTDGNPALGIEATELIAKWFNTVQRKLVVLVHKPDILNRGRQYSGSFQSIIHAEF